MGADKYARELEPPLEEGVYCMRCRARRPLADARRATLSSGRPVLKGRCPICSAPLFRIGARVTRPS